MTIIKSFAVGAGDMFYIKHPNGTFTIIDCDLCEENANDILAELKAQSKGATIKRFICTHPDEDHFGGIERLDDEMPIVNFYVVKNQAIKKSDTPSFERYCKLRDSDKAYYLAKDCSRKWLNKGDDERGGSGLKVLWPDISNQHFKEALKACDAGDNYNNTSAVVRYGLKNGASFMWLGDLETEFMHAIANDIELAKTTVVFAAHHGRDSGKIPNSWLEKLDPQIIVIGEAPARHLNYYTGYKTITQNHAGDITFHLEGDQVHIYVANPNYEGPDILQNQGESAFGGYIGSLKVETEYTL